MKYIWLILLGLMILGFAAASFFSKSLLAPTKVGPAELIIPKANSPEKKPEPAAASVVPHREKIPAASDRRSQQKATVINRTHKFEPLIVRRIPINEAIRIRLAAESSKPVEQSRPSKSDQPVAVTDPYAPNCDPDREICASARSKSRPRRVGASPSNTPESQSPAPTEQKEKGVLKAIKKIIPGGNVPR